MEKQVGFPSRPATWTKQNMFDHICQCLAIQERRSVNDYGMCMYRGDEGRKCAIGHCIPDEEYQPIFERLTMLEVVDRVPSLSSKMRTFMSDMQECHDASRCVHALRSSLEVVSVRYGLDSSCIELIQRWG